MDELKVFGCNASKEFTQEICDNLGIELGKSEAFKFDNDNTFVKILETVRGDDVFVIQSSVPPVERISTPPFANSFTISSSPSL